MNSVTTINKVLAFQDNGNIDIEVKAGSTFCVDPDYRDAATQEIASYRSQLDNLSSQEKPKKNVVILWLHMISCTPCTENIHTYGRSYHR